MRYLLLVLLASHALTAQQKGRVFLISLDGLGYQAFSEDPASSELKTMKKLASEGIYAPMQAAFPSQTAPGHASIFTGVYGDRNGVTANNVPIDFENYANGFRAEQLKAEMFWVKAGRAGVKSVAHNPTQGYPCNAFNSGTNVTLVNGYQTASLAPQTLLSAKDAHWLDNAPAGFAMPPSSRMPARYFKYDSGRIQFTGVVFAKGLRYDTIRMTAYSGKRYVDAAWKDGESEPVRTGNGPARALARHFSEGLPVSNLTAVHFRLFELSADGSDFLLYQTEAKEMSICSGGQTQAEAFKERLLSTSGGFVGNGAGSLYRTGKFGPTNADGLAERRWLETLELHARQTMRHTRALMGEFDPRLLVDYISTPDDMLHEWWGRVADGAKSNEILRRWGYQIIDWRIDQLRLMLKADDHLVIVSDHGMTAVDREVRVNTLLKDLGFEGKATGSACFIRLKDRTDTALLDEVKRKLSEVRDEGKPVFTSWYLPSEFAAKFGIGGPFGGDLYFDLVPGYVTTHLPEQPAIAKLSSKRGEHGMLPTRPELQALFLAYGPEIQSRRATMKSIDVAPFVLRLLGQ